jgi:hypothetical protein
LLYRVPAQRAFRLMKDSRPRGECGKIKKQNGLEQFAN